MSFTATSCARAALRRRPRLARTLATATSAPTPSSPAPRGPAAPQFNHSTLTGEQASEFLSHLLSLPPSAAFPPALALQILTHKSYRFVHRVAHPPPYTSEELAQGQADHNGRLSFLGRRAIAAYSAMFLHSALGSASNVYDADFLRGNDIESKLDLLRNTTSLGETVGPQWRVSQVMRCDRQQTGRSSNFAKIQGVTVEAIMGGVFTQHGSPAAQRLFHAQLLPHVRGLHDPELTAASRAMQGAARNIGVVAK